MVVTVEMLDDLAVVTLDNPPVNATSHALRQGLLAAVATCDASSVRAVVLLARGRTFVAGADIREFGQPPRDPILPDVIRAIEAARVPWLAAVHGTVLGGGLELALGCAWRIAAPGTRLGLPEVTLGLIPGAGGTVRLPRLVGARAALEMVASGRPVGAGRALEMGLIDRIAEGDLRAAALAFAREDRQRPATLLDRPVTGDLPDCAAVARKARGQRSPVAACEAIRAAMTLPVEEALAAERALFLELQASDQSAALRHVFFAEREAAKVGGADMPPPERIGVVGGGTMGAGIAAACLLRGLSVTLVERDRAALEAGLGRIGEVLDGSEKRGLIDTDARAAMQARLSGATDHAALAGADLVIEAVFEDMAVKREVFAALDRAAPRAVLATNTSYLDVGAIAAAVADPSRVIGLHFFSPPHVMKLLELVVPPEASPEAVGTGAALGRRLGKTLVASGVCDGFIGNRVMSAYRREAVAMLDEGLRPAAIDAAMRDYGFPMGVFEMQDLAGLDIAHAARVARGEAVRGAPRSVADHLVEAGEVGRKSGRGFYLHGAESGPNPRLETLLPSETTAEPAAIMDRLLAAMQAEGRAILEEGIARRPGDIDVVLVAGYGFPRWKGGPMYAGGMR